MSSTFPMSACVHFCVPNCTVHTETFTQSPSQPRQNTITKSLQKTKFYPFEKWDAYFIREKANHIRKLQKEAY